VTIVIAPINSPLTPSPAIARPAIRAADDGATPQISDPSSKRKMKKRYTVLMGKKVYSLPARGCRVAAASV
jgi:hypothetical protein